MKYKRYRGGGGGRSGAGVKEEEGEGGVASGEGEDWEAGEGRQQPRAGGAGNNLHNRKLCSVDRRRLIRIVRCLGSAMRGDRAKDEYQREVLLW